MLIKAVTQDIAVSFEFNILTIFFNPQIKEKQDMKTLYTCPVYKTRQRGIHTVFLMDLSKNLFSQVQHMSGHLI